MVVTPESINPIFPIIAILAIVTAQNMIPNTLARTVSLQVVMCVVILLSYVVGYRFVNLGSITVLQWIVTALLSAVVLLFVCIVVFILIDVKTFKSVLASIKNKLRK